MSRAEPSSVESLEEAREMIWESMQTLEAAQRVLFRAGDRYVAQVWGDGVRAVLDATEKITDISGDLSAAHIEIGRLVRKDRARGAGPG